MKREQVPATNKHAWLSLRNIILGFSLVVLGVVIILVVLGGGDTDAPVSKSDTPTNKASKPHTSKQPKKPKAPLVDLQPTLDDWLKNQQAQYGVEVFDVANQQVIAKHNPDLALFTASLYKLYVAYFGYRKMTNGSYSDSPNYQANRSRLTCLYVMIQESDSPCAETMMRELGRKWMDRQLLKLGMKDTNLVALMTSAHDMNTLINDIIKTKDIAPKYKHKLFDSMGSQIYRKGFEQGFTKVEKISSKVGFNLDKNYHESSLVTLKDGRQYIVTLVSQGQGSPRPLADLASRFQATLLESQYQLKQPRQAKWQ